MELSPWIGRASTGLLAACWIVVTWLITYSVHVAISASIAALCTWRRRAQSVALGSAARHHRLWKLALWLPLATAVGSAALGTVSRQPTALLSLAGPHAALSPRRIGLVVVATRPAAADRAAEGLAGGVALALLVGMARFVRCARQVSRQLRSRAPSGNSRFHQRLAGVTGSSPKRRAIRLTESREVDGPLVVGTAEICLPAEGLGGLSDPELDAVLAHELAHLERRDGLWVPCTTFLRACLWFHPLTRWVSSRVAETAELACDDRAVSLMRDPGSLARALAQVAAAATPKRSSSMVAAMANRRSTLLVRVQRLAHPEEIPSCGSRSRPPHDARAMASVLASLACLCVSIHLSPPVPQARARAAAAASPDRAAALGARMTALSFEESRASARLAEQMHTSAHLGVAGEDSPAVLELRQEVRHLRAMQAWTEAELAAATSASSRPSE